MDRAETNLNIMDLPSIFQALSAAKRSGTLRVTRQDEEKLIYFRKGSIESVVAPRKKQRMLGEALMKYGAITEEQLQEALQKQREWRIDLGGALLRLGVVQEEELQKALVFQLTEEICEVVAWQDVHCEFRAGEPPEEISKLSREGVAVSVNPESVIMEAARRIDEWELLKQTLPSMKDVFVVIADITHYYENPSQDGVELEVVSYIDGLRDVSEVVEKARMSKFEVLKTLYNFVTQKEIAPLTPIQLAQLAANCASQGQFEKCIKLYERAEELGLTEFDLDCRLARTYEALGKGDKAIKKYIAHAEQALQDGDIDETIVTYGKIVGLNKWELKTHEKLIDILMSHERHEEALAESANLSQKLLERGEESKAISMWQKMTEALPSSPDPYRHLADMHRRAHRTVQTIIELENLAGLYLSGEMAEEAIATFREMLELDRECVQARLSLAATLADTGKTEEAVNEYNALAETLSKSGVIHDSGNWTFLMDIYEKIVTLEPSNVSSREWLSRAYIENGLNDKAVSCLRQMAEIRRAEGRLADIPKPLKRIIELQPEDTDTQLELSKVYFELGDILNAVETYRQIVETALEKREFGLAKRAATRLLKADPYNVVAHQALADVFADVGEKDRQLDELRKVGWLSYFSDDYATAVKAFEEVLRLDKKSVEIALALSNAYELSGDNEKAFRYYISLAKNSLKRNDLSIARWAGQRALQIDGKGKSAEPKDIIASVDDKEAILKKNTQMPTIERPSRG